jgi:hypothetical protein
MWIPGGREKIEVSIATLNRFMQNNFYEKK